MQTIYTPRGRALEYHDLAVNLYRGCGHACSYCYAPAAIHLDRQAFCQRPVPRAGILEALEIEAAKYEFRGDRRHILMCFSCDPYQPEETEHQVTRRAITILKRHLLNVSILTKGGMRAARDFDLLTGEDRFGATLTFVNDDDSLQWEPKAALPDERMQALNLAHDRGIPTWVSLEPVIDPVQTLAIIDATHEYVDEYKVGTLNYVSNQTDWRSFARAATVKLDGYGCRYYLKEDLRNWLR